jgi:DNA-binding NtrC family response regulator
MAGGVELLDERYLIQAPAAMHADAGSQSVPTLGGTMLSPRSAPTEPVLNPPPNYSNAPNVDSNRLKPAASADAAIPGLGERIRPLREVVSEAERAYIMKALQAAGGSKTRAAELLDISRKNLWEKMRDLGITT